MVHPIEEHEGDAGLQGGLGQGDLALGGDGQAGGVIRVGNDHSGYLPAGRGGKFHTGLDAFLCVSPALGGIARCPKHVGTDTVRAPVIGNPGYAGDH